MKKYLVLKVWKEPAADFTGYDIHIRVLYEFDNYERAKAMVDSANKHRGPYHYFELASIPFPKF